jgi:hypothetical protein
MQTASATTRRAGDRPVELRPPPVLAIGVTGHRRIGIESPEALAVESALGALLRELERAFNAVVAADRSFFSDAEPIVRLVGTAADGSSLLGARSARTLGADIACVLPFALEEYKKDFSSPAALELAATVVAGARSLFILPGERGEGRRAYERASNVVLANIDLLIAVWNGERAGRRGGTGDVVQSAVSFGIPVLVIDPKSPARPGLLRDPGEDRLENPIATDLYREPLGDDLRPLLFQTLAPPSGLDKRQGLVDLYGEEPGRWAPRFEYPLLLKVFRVARVRMTAVGDARPDAASGQTNEGETDIDANGGDPEGRLRELRRCRHLIDDFSSYFGRLFRSSNASKFLLIIFAALISATLAIIFPSVFGVWIVGQMIVNVLVLIDARIGSKRRWQQRWLDYRLISERLRCLRFLHPLGLGLDRTSDPGRHTKQSWVEWYVRRIERGLGAPAGRMRSADIARSARRLADLELQEQINYHRKAYRQFGRLERRLSTVARLALWTTIAVAAAFGVSAAFVASFDAAAWKPFALVLLFALPAAASAFNGVRAEADLVRLAERSAAAAVALARLRRIIFSASPTYDRIAAAAMRAAAIMGSELSEWRFVLERRRARARRPPFLGHARSRPK